jgi:hypothetical protein
MQRFFLSCGVFLGSCLISASSPLFIKSAPKDQPFSAIKYQAKSPFQKKLYQSDSRRPQSAFAQGGQVGKAVLILETRNNRITVYSGENSLLYTVCTGGGAILAERLKGSDLKDRFPELYDIVTGTAWAGEIHTP